jgi:hypothetical protein
MFLTPPMIDAAAVDATAKRILSRENLIDEVIGVAARTPRSRAVLLSMEVRDAERECSVDRVVCWIAFLG